MRLIADGEMIPITHMGRDFLLVRSLSDHPPGDATIILQVDKSERQWKVRLPKGISKNSRRVALALTS